MSIEFAEHIIDTMVDENGECGERGLSAKQFSILSAYLEPTEWKYVTSWHGDYGMKDFYARDYIGNIGKYHVVLNWYAHFNDRYIVKSITKRPEDEVEKERWLRQLGKFEHSGWKYEPKQRVELELIFVREYKYERTSFAGYGTDLVHIYTLADDEGNCYVWKTTSPLAIDEEDEHHYWEYRYAEVGEKVVMKATVKENTEYKGVKQTVISRPTILKIG